MADSTAVQGLIQGLIQDFSSSACERNWSTFFNIHTKKRNRLSVKQLERLVYCRENLRIIEKYKSPVGGLRQSIQRDLNCFLDADRSTRRGALERILKWMAKKTWSDCASLDVFQEAWDDVILPKLLKVCNDSMEKCRELAVQVIVTAAKQVPKVDMTTALVVPVIAKRIGQLPFLEESEEIRLSCIRLFNTLIVPQCSLETLNKVSDSLFQVLCIALGDPFHEIKKAAAGVMMVIVEREVKLVDGRTESLLRALVPNISHAHSKVRISILQAVDAIMNCDVPAVLIAEYVAPSMRALAFDRAAGVRELFFTSLARWLGYEKNSNHKVDNQTSVRSQRNPEARICPLLPSLLTGVLDDSPDIGTMNLLLVEGVGEVYLYFEAKACDEVETMNTKNEVSCIAPGCEGQMSEMELDNCTDRWFDGLSLPRPFKRRPQKGCRMMVQNFFAHLASTAMKDLRDWTAQTRLGGAKMLHVLLIVAEDHAVKHLHFLIPSLCSAVGDEDASVSQQIVKAVHVLGYCVSPSSWISLMFDHLLASSASLPQVANGLVVLSGLLFGTPSGSLDSAAIEKILGRIGQLQLGCMEDPAIQRQLLAVLTNLVHASQSISGSSASDILFLLLQLQANRELREAAKEVERALSQAVACLSVEELYQQNLQNLLTAVTTNYDTWSGNLPAQSVFVIFMQKAGTVVGPYMPSLLNLFSECLQPDRDSAMRISFLQLLDELFEIPELGTCWSSLSVQVIASILVPCGVWQPGKAEAAIRHATMVALGTFLRRDLCNQVEVASILSSQQLLALLSSCLDEDYYVDIRRVSCHVMEHILRISGELMQDNERNNVKKMLEKRLDDSSDLVRLVIIPAISAFFASMPDSYGDEHVKSFVRSIILHMDDANPQIKEAIGKALEICAHKRPLILEEVLNNARNKHQSIDYCEHLLKYIKAEAMIE